jgi:hypothetical protein
MDSRVVPNLTIQSTHIQVKDIFAQCVRANFAGLQALYAPHVGLTWVMFTFYPARAHPEFLQSAIRALSTLHIGKTENQLLITESRYAYDDALTSLRKAINPSDLSNEIFAAAIILAMYEMINGSSQASWVSPTNNIGKMMPSDMSFSSGFGRTLFLTFRPFLIRAALSHGQACSLDRDEWISMCQSMIHSENHSGRGSVFWELNENAFIELVKVPGLAARSYSLHLASKDMGLMDETVRCRNRLKEVQRRIEFIFEELQSETNIPTLKHYLGPIPFQLAKIIVQQALYGLQSALTFLEYLVQHQSAHHLSQRQYAGVASATRVVITPTYSTLKEFHAELRMSYDVLHDAGWLDVCALSMGVIPTRDVFVFPWQYQYVVGGI